MQAWEDIVKTALVGTERQAPTAGGDSGAVDALLGRLTSEDRERTLLGAAAALACCRKAGYRPLTDRTSLPPAAEETDLPRCRAAAAQDLRLMLGGEYQQALPDWLGAVAAEGQRVPEELLPELLRMARGNQALRPAILPVLGARGRWLAAQNPDWRFALQRTLSADEDSPNALRDEEAWQTGTHDERAAVLARIRRRDPGRAREMLEATWGQDPPEDRASFLKTFADGLSMKDEPFLESALDDRRKEVRREAQELLLRLPESRLCRRMLARTTPLLTLKKPHDGPEDVEVSLPEVPDRAALRDGIEPKPPHGTGEKAWWLLQMVARVPVRLWNSHFGRPVAAILAANRSQEWSETLWTAWTEAAQRDRDPEWMEALLDVWIERRGGRTSPGLTDWGGAVPKAALESRVMRLLEVNRGVLTGGHPATPLLQLCGPVWSVELAQAVIDNFAVHAGDSEIWSLSTVLAQYVSFIPNAMLDAWIAVWKGLSEKEPYVRNQLDKHLALTRFRREMLARIKEI